MATATTALENALAQLEQAAALAGLVYAFMRPELRFKAIGYGAFLLACAVAVWPEQAVTTPMGSRYPRRTSPSK